MTTALVPFLALAGLAPAALAQNSGFGPASGSRLTFAGSADALDVGAAGVVLTFDPAALQSANTGSFASLDPATAAPLAIRSLTVGEGRQSVVGLLTVGGYTFHLTGLPSGGFGQVNCKLGQADPEAGQTCSPIQTPGTAISPFELVNLEAGVVGPSVGSVASFNLVGTVTGPGGGPASVFTGTIAAYFPLPYQYVLGALEDAAQVGAGLSGLQYEGTFVVGAALVTPEPTTFAVLGAGLVALVGAARRRRR